MQPVIEFRDVQFGYGQRIILQKINFCLYPGRFILILGASGSGKSTLLRLATGLVRPTAGSVLIHGRDTATFLRQDWQAFYRELGFLFQGGALFSDKNVADNLAFVLQQRRELTREQIDRRVANYLQAVHLQHAAELMPSELSGGMITRAALARAMITGPAVMMYDEPFTGLDPIALQEGVELIRTLYNQEKQSALLVSHDIGPALELVDEVVFLEQGHLVFTGPAKELFQAQHPSLRRFLAAAQFVGDLKNE